MPGLQTTPPEVHTAPPPARSAMCAELQRQLRRPGERVTPRVHRRRPGVRGLALPGDEVALDAERAQNDAERQVKRLEHGALLDVQLEVGGCVLELAPGLERAVEVDAVLGERVGQRHAVGVAPLAQLVLVGHRAGRRAGAEQRAAEAGALLVGPVDESHGDRGLAVLGQPAQHLDAAHDVEAAVEPAAVRHRVDVAADQQRALGGAAQREPLVARLVDLLLDRHGGELPAQPFARPLPRLRPGDALGAVLVSGQLLELAQLLDGAGGLQRHGASLVAD